MNSNCDGKEMSNREMVIRSPKTQSSLIRRAADIVVIYEPSAAARVDGVPTA